MIVTDRPTDYATPFATVGRIYAVLRYGLKRHSRKREGDRWVICAPFSDPTLQTKVVRQIKILVYHL